VANRRMGRELAQAWYAGRVMVGNGQRLRDANPGPNCSAGSHDRFVFLSGALASAIGRGTNSDRLGRKRLQGNASWVLADRSRLSIPKDGILAQIISPSRSALASRLAWDPRPPRANPAAPGALIRRQALSAFRDHPGAASVLKQLEPEGFVVRNSPRSHPAREPSPPANSAPGTRPGLVQV